jgi:hypothetical protein
MEVTGGCLCGGVRYAVNGPLRRVIACHCGQCRRWSGNYVAATRALTADLSFAAADTLAWYRSSDAAERGFCTRCGSSLFWRRTEPGAPWTSIMAGTLDPPTGLALAEHIFVADKADYYDIADGLPQHTAWPE